ncbi:hypothetical protein ACYOEI_30285, partial [Singulisphaera rosea]
AGAAIAGSGSDDSDEPGPRYGEGEGDELFEAWVRDAVEEPSWDGDEDDEFDPPNRKSLLSRLGSSP